MPQYRYRGSNASLLCKYELEPNEELYSLKWYKQDTEFYRHTPPTPQPPPMTGNSWDQHGSPQSRYPINYPQQKNQESLGLVQTWPVPGIKIDVRRHYLFNRYYMSLTECFKFTESRESDQPLC